MNSAATGYTVPAVSCAWLYNVDLRPENTALIGIDTQIDFCGKVGYVDAMGYDLEFARTPIELIKTVLTAIREMGYHTTQVLKGHRPDLSHLPENKRQRSQQIGAGIGGPGLSGKILVQGVPGRDIIEELDPEPDGIIVDKLGKGLFCTVDLASFTRSRGIQNIVRTGITIILGISTTMGKGNDRGFKHLLLEKRCRAPNRGNHVAAINMEKMQGGVFGLCFENQALVKGLPGT